MRCAALLVLVACFAAASAGAQQAAEDDALVSPIRSSLALVDAAGAPVERAAVGVPSVLRLSLMDALGGGPERLYDTRAYIRSLDGEPAQCAARVRMFRATGAVASTDHALRGTLILSLSAENRLSLADPSLPDARNTIAVRLLPGGGFRLVHDDARGRYFIQSRSGEGLYRVRMPDLALMPLAEGRSGHLHLDEAGAVLVGENEAWRIDEAGRVAVLPLPPGPWRLAAEVRSPVFAASDGRLLAFPATRAERAVTVTRRPGDSVLAASADGALVAVARKELLTVLVAGSGAEVDIPIGRPAVAAWFAPDGRHLLALHQDRRTLVVVDIAEGQLVQAAALLRPLANLVFVGDTGFLQTDDAMLQRFPVSSLASGRSIALLPATTPDAAFADRFDTELPALADMADGSGVLASNRAGDRIARIAIEDHPALNGAPPPAAPTALRTGRSLALASVERGFVQKRPGLYEASFLPRAAGEHLLVLADSRGRFSACHIIRVGEDDPRREAERHARLVLDSDRSRLSGDEPSRIVFSVQSAVPVATPASAALDIMSFATHWRGRGVAERQPDGSFLATLRFPGAGTYVVQPRVAGANQAFAKPLLISIP